MHKLATCVAVAALALGTVPASAALVNLDNGTVADTETKLIWTFSWSSGRVNWWEATDWAASLDFAGASDWMLPSLDDFASLWAHLDWADDPLALIHVFADVDPTYGYWTHDETGPDTALLVRPVIGPSSIGVEVVDHFKWGPKSAIAVRLPEPSTLPLTLTTLGTLLLLATRRRLR